MNMKVATCQEQSDSKTRLISVEPYSLICDKIKRMKVIPREVRRITYSAKIRDLKKRLALNPDQQSLIVGSVLGDGYLEPNWSKTNYRLKIQHSIKQKDYVLWKHALLSEWVITEPKEQKVNHSIRFRTISHPELTEFRELFYRGNKKIIPEDVSKYLNPLALAVWFMDDGDRAAHDKTDGYHINTQSFSESENHFLLSVLREKFGIDGTVQNNNGYKRLYVVSKSKDLFRAIVAPYILPAMQYKLG